MGEGGREGVPSGGWARGVGIEKTLLVQEGIQKVRYSKESVSVDFHWDRFLDGGRPSATPLPPPNRQSPSILPSFERQENQGALFQRKWCPQRKIVRTIPLNAPNLAHVRGAPPIVSRA